jgi:transcriptional regulator with XRE-family HTH domain
LPLLNNKNKDKRLPLVLPQINTKKNNMVIGTNIRKERILKGYSQEWLAQRLGISQNVISDIENGKVDIKMSKLEEIANVISLEEENNPLIKTNAKNSLFDLNFDE